MTPQMGFGNYTIIRKSDVEKIALYDREGVKRN
jgi:hypothetical protein